MRNVVQIRPLMWHPQTEVSCSKLAKTRRTAAACRQCGATALAQSPGLCRSDAADATFYAGASLRELRVGDTFQDRRQPGHQNAVTGDTAAGQQLPQSSQPGWASARHSRGAWSLDTLRFGQNVSKEP